jgi:hypothetical protein
MTYVSDEASIESGQPVELYEFIGPDAVANVYRYTSADADVTFDPGDGGGSRTFTAIGIKRSNVQLDQTGKAPSITVTTPVDAQLAVDYVFQVAPQELYLTIFRAHIGVGTEEVVISWQGEVISWLAEENIAKFVIPNDLVARMSEEVPRVRYQPYCNNVLYDGLCGITRDGIRVYVPPGGVLSLTDTTVNVDVTARPDGWSEGGDIVHDATGETRMVLSQVGNVLTILYPFSPNVDVSDAVTLSLGCNHTLDHCVNKFQNQDNFNGMPFVLSQATTTTQSGD